MATFGQGINPQLGRLDYSPIMQGAQIAAQGQARAGEYMGNALANIGAQAGQAIQAYRANKEERETYATLVEQKGQRFMSSLPKLQEAGVPIEPYQKLIEQAKDAPKMSLGKLKAFNSEFDAAMMQADKSVAQRVQMAQLKEFEAQAQSRDAIRRTVSPGFPLADRSPENLYRVMVSNGADPATAAQVVGQISPRGMNPLEEALKKAQIAKTQAEAAALGAPKQISPAEQARLDMERERLDLEKTRFKSQESEKQQKEADTSQKFLSRADSMMADLNRQMQLLSQAETLSMRGAGGPVAGRAFIRDINAMQPIPGSGDAMVLNSIYNSLRSGERIRKMQELKEFSPTGATGFGNQSDKEGAALEQTYTEFDTSLPEAEQLSRIRNAKGRINKLRFALANDIRKVGGTPTGADSPAVPDGWSIIP